MNVRVIKWNKPAPATEQYLRGQLQVEGMKPYTSVMERDEFADTHQHQYDETRIVIEGKVEFSAEGRSHTLEKGDRIDIRKGTAHTAKNLMAGQSIMLCGSGGNIWQE